MERYVSEVLDRLGRQQKEIEQFVDNKTYVDTLDKWVGEAEHKTVEINSSDFDRWTADVALTFMLLYEKSSELGVLRSEEVTIKYKDSYITMCEMHGQGCFQSISIDNVPKKIFVEFADLEGFINTGIKPEKYYVLSTIKTGLDVLDTIGVQNEVDMTAEDIWEYLLNNLN